MDPNEAIRELQKDVKSLDQRLKAVEKDSHPPVDFGKMFDDLNRRLDQTDKVIRELVERNA